MKASRAAGVALSAGWGEADDEVTGCSCRRVGVRGL